MKNNPRNYLLAVLGIAVVGLCSIAWTGNHQNNSHQSIQDTIPKAKKSVKAPAKEYKKDLDKELNELDRASLDIRNMPDIDFSKIQVQIDAAMQKVDEEMTKHRIDMDKMQKELNESLSKINTEKMQSDVRKSLKELDKLDVEKIQREVRESLSKIDHDKWQDDIDESLKGLDKLDLDKMKKEMEEAIQEVKTKVDPEAIRKQVQESLSKVDMDKIRIDVDKVKEEMEKNKDNMKMDMGNVRKEVEKAKAELKGYQEMIYGMEKDGLLKTSTDYKIEYKNGELFINDKKQSALVTNKYKKYFSKDGVTIRKEKGKMNINIQ